MMRQFKMISCFLLQNLGVIVPSKGRVFMPDEEKASVCGVFLALVYK